MWTTGATRSTRTDAVAWPRLPAASVASARSVTEGPSPTGTAVATKLVPVTTAGTPSTVTLTGDASVTEPRTSRAVAAVTRPGAGSSIITTGAVRSRFSVRLDVVWCDVRSVAVIWTLLAPSVSGTLHVNWLPLIVAVAVASPTRQVMVTAGARRAT